MMPINEALEVLKKMRDCRTSLWCNTIYCTECPHEESHIRKIAALEAAIEYIERRAGENHEHDRT